MRRKRGAASRFVVIAALVVSLTSACSSGPSSSSGGGPDNGSGNRFAAWVEGETIYVASTGDPHPRHFTLPIPVATLENMEWSTSGEQLIVSYLDANYSVSSILVDGPTLHITDLPGGVVWLWMGDMPFSYRNGELVELTGKTFAMKTLPLRATVPQKDLATSTVNDGTIGDVAWSLNDTGLTRTYESGQVKWAPEPSFVKLISYNPASLSPDALTLAVANDNVTPPALYLENATTGRLTPISLPSPPAGHMWTSLMPYYDPSGTLQVTLGDKTTYFPQYQLDRNRLVPTGRQAIWSSADDKIALELTGTNESLFIDGEDEVNLTAGKAPIFDAIAGYPTTL